MTALGIAFVPTLAPGRLRSLVTAAEEARLDQLWVWEDCFKQSAIASATAALAWSEEITVGIGLMPAPLRNVALTAMEIATVADMFPGRIIAGVGHGVQDWMGQVGGRVASPLTLLEEYATALRRLLHGEEVTVSGRYVQLDRVRLDWPPEVVPPVMLGGFGPKTLRLSGRLGDGVLLAGALTPDQVAESVGVARAASERTDLPFVFNHIAAAGPGAADRLAGELPKWGGRPDAGIGIAGDGNAIAASVRELASAGVTTVVIQPTEDEPYLEGFVRYLGQRVKPLL